jgi:hypothetical protein
LFANFVFHSEDGKKVSMGTNSDKILTGTLFVLADVLYVYFLGGFVSPELNDSAHAIGMLNAKAGIAMHPIEYALDGALLLAEKVKRKDVSDG